MIERSLAVPLRKIWGEMKENGRLASEHHAGLGAMQLLAEDVRDAGKSGDKSGGGKTGGKWELHIVAHSAGSRNNFV